MGGECYFDLGEFERGVIVAVCFVVHFYGGLPLSLEGLLGDVVWGGQVEGVSVFV